MMAEEQVWLAVYTATLAKLEEDPVDPKTHDGCAGAAALAVEHYKTWAQGQGYIE